MELSDHFTVLAIALVLMIIFSEDFPRSED